MSIYLLGDGRLDDMLWTISLQYVQAQVAAGYVPDSNKWPYHASTWAYQEGARLVVKRGLKALRAGKPLPGNVTAAQAKKGITSADIGPLYERLLTAIHKHLQQAQASVNSPELQTWKSTFPAPAAA